MEEWSPNSILLSLTLTIRLWQAIEDHRYRLLLVTRQLRLSECKPSSQCTESIISQACRFWRSRDQVMLLWHWLQSREQSKLKAQSSSLSLISKLENALQEKLSFRMVKILSVRSVSKDSTYLRNLLPRQQLSVNSVPRAKLFAKEEMKLVQISTTGGKVTWQMFFCRVWKQMFV